MGSEVGICRLQDALPLVSSFLLNIVFLYKASVKTAPSDLHKDGASLSGRNQQPVQNLKPQNHQRQMTQLKFCLKSDQSAVVRQHVVILVAIAVDCYRICSDWSS